jgi:uncharacterized membrane protein
MLEDPQSIVSVLLRWAHIIFGIIWLSQLFFFHLINTPLQQDLSDDLKTVINPKLLLRIHYWARKGALYTVIFGWLLFGYKYGHQKLLLVDGALSNRAIWILFGDLLGTVMWFNVWFVIWPRQRALLAGLISGKAPADAAKMTTISARASRFNLFASGPLLFAMVVPNNYPGWTPLALILVCILGVGFWFGPLKRSFKVKTEV